MACTGGQTIQALPVLYVRAKNHYDVGKTIGSTFKGWIGEYLETTDPLQLRKFYKTSAGRTIYEEYLAAAQQCCPHTVDEIRGMADGAGQPFENLFLLQILSEVLFSDMKELIGSDIPYNGEGCTDVLVNKSGLRMIAHNDDWDDDVAKRCYIVDVTIDSNRNENEAVSSPIKGEHFVSFVYPGYLPGFCFGMNEKLVITLNTLVPVSARRGRVPVTMLLRSLLACDTIEECQRTMQNAPVGCAYGMNVNVATIEGNEMYSMEVYADENDTKTHVYSVPYGPDANSFYHHQNHYKHLTAKEQNELTGTKIRDRRVTEMGAPDTPQDVRAILGDTQGPVEPLYRVPLEGHYEKTSRTVATAVFNINERRLDVYRTNPKLADQPCLSMSFIQNKP